MFPISVHLIEILRLPRSRARSVLQDITPSPTGGHVYSESNISQLDYYLASADELIIQERSQREFTSGSTDLSTSLCFCEDNDESFNSNGDFLQTTPAKSDDVSGLPRKRLRLSSPDLNRRYMSTPIKEKDQICCASPSFSEELEAYGRGQLVTVLDRLVSCHPELESEIRESLQSPDLTPLEERLAFIQQIIYRVLPSIRWDTGRGVFSFRKVKVHLMMFRRTCVDQLRTLVACESWEAVVNYVAMAWMYVAKLPNWEEAHHNRIKIGCYAVLASSCSNAIQQGQFDRNQLLEMLIKLRSCQRTDGLIVPSIKLIENLLEKVH